MAYDDGSADEVTVPILLLGDTVGKSTFLSRLTLGAASLPSDPLPQLRDESQPFVFTITPATRHITTSRGTIYRLEVSDTSSPTNYTLLRPAVIVLCFSVASRQSLRSIHTSWKYLVETHFNYDGNIPVMLLGLQRDLRTLDGPGTNGQPVKDVRWAPKNKGGYEEQLAPDLERSVLPQEGLRIAQEMLCDRYAECCAVTGELCKEVFEDIVQMAVATTKRPGGGKSEGFQCALM